MVSNIMWNIMNLSSKIVCFIFILITCYQPTVAQILEGIDVNTSVIAVGCDGVSPGIFISDSTLPSFTRLLDTPESPRGIGYDPQEACIYWTGPTEARIYKCQVLSCSDTLQVVLDSLGDDLRPFGIAIDNVGRNIYWSDVQNQNLYISPVASPSEYTVIPTEEGSPYAMDVTYDAKAKIFYWTSLFSNTIGCYNAAENQRCNDIILVDANPSSVYPRGITTDDDGMILVGRSFGDDNGILRVHPTDPTFFPQVRYYIDYTALDPIVGITITGEKIFFAELRTGLKDVPITGGSPGTIHSDGLNECQEYNAVASFVVTEPVVSTTPAATTSAPSTKFQTTTTATTTDFPTTDPLTTTPMDHTTTAVPPTTTPMGVTTTAPPTTTTMAPTTTVSTAFKTTTSAKTTTKSSTPATTTILPTTTLRTTKDPTTFSETTTDLQTTAERVVTRQTTMDPSTAMVYSKGTQFPYSTTGIISTPNEGNLRKQMTVEDKTLTTLSQVLLTISIICLVALLIIYAICRLYRSIPIIIHSNMAISLLLAQLVFVIGIETQLEVPCIIVTALLHYLWLVVFLCMAIEGFSLFLKVTPTLAWYIKLHVYVGIAWGVPLPVMIFGVFLGATNYARNVTNNFRCWLPVAQGLLVATFGILILMISLANIAFALVFIRKYLLLKAKDNQKDYIRFKSSIRAFVILVIVLTFTWIFGISHFARTSGNVFGYLFIIGNIILVSILFLRYSQELALVRV
ncbi:uncharacterized protein [Amphiura filiformis]|uniref:uncharacterized protein n=1 Tax=Amphiura filiformis TaxID=82378 RepID=UPI003B21BC74